MSTGSSSLTLITLRHSRAWTEVFLSLFPEDISHVQVDLNQFAAGEHALRCPLPPGTTHCLIIADVEADPSSLFSLLCLAKVLRLQGATWLELVAPWIAYGRQDRMEAAGEAPSGLVVGSLLADAFDHIITFDAHSQRFLEAFQGKVTNVFADPRPFALSDTIDFVIAPDKGARERAAVAAGALLKPVVWIDKVRENGSVSSKLSDPTCVLEQKTVLLVDDMADSGSTLAAAAQIAREAGASRVIVFLPHALSHTKLVERTNGLVDQIVATYNHETGAIPDHQLQLLKYALKWPQT